ncbi:unnamed protein product [Danaus chrysippus]|uniref:(African queen) hypothetical protein n=1 Tax=Danaus chrysippus TaxID=151541 RepID=A0A8J2QYN4_9NEOP|nr:unnamed protein product [Danaus chrysippus]
MSSKLIVFCAQAFFIQSILGQCIGNVGSSYNLGNCDLLAARRNYDWATCGNTNAQWSGAQLGLLEGLSASSGGGLNVQAVSPVAPGSISIISENQIQGPLEVSGTLPFLSAVAFEGSLPTRGSGEVLYQCGNGRVGILEENYQDSSLNSGFLGGNSEYLGVGWNGASAFNGIGNCLASEPVALGWNGASAFNGIGGCLTQEPVATIYGQCINVHNGIYDNPANNPAITGIPNNYYANELIMPNGLANGGGLFVKSSSPITPSGVTIQSDNLLFEGPLAVSGQLPFLGVVALEGPLQAAGSGAVAYGCGNGNVGITSENLTPTSNAIGVGIDLTGLGLPIH